MNTPGGSARFFRLAERTFAFKGVMQVRAIAESQDPKTAGSKAPSGKLKVANPTAQRVNLREKGAETATVKLEGESYLHDLFRTHGYSDN